MVDIGAHVHEYTIQNGDDSLSISMTISGEIQLSLDTGKLLPLARLKYRLGKIRNHRKGVAHKKGSAIILSKSHWRVYK